MRLPMKYCKETAEEIKINKMTREERIKYKNERRENNETTEEEYIPNDLYYERFYSNKTIDVSDVMEHIFKAAEYYSKKAEQYVSDISDLCSVNLEKSEEFLKFIEYKKGNYYKELYKGHPQSIAIAQDIVALRYKNNQIKMESMKYEEERHEESSRRWDETEERIKRNDPEYERRKFDGVFGDGSYDEIVLKKKS